MGISALPLDVWVIIMKYIDNDKLLSTFNVLCLSQALNVPCRHRLDAFWTIISQARYLAKCEEEASFPNVEAYQHTFRQLREMGVSVEDASHAVSVSNGNMDDAMSHLWQI